MSRSIKRPEIYIVGYSLRLPESNSPFELHENLLQKKNMVTSDSRRWPVEYQETPPYFGKIKQSLDQFDGLFFGIPGKQAEKLDPQLRLLLETSYEALVDAAISSDEIKGSSMGVYTGSCTNDAYQIAMKNMHALTGYELTGASQSMFANRLSYFYDIHGPSFNVDTACASSLTALHYAIRDLQHGVCDAAFVCGSTILLNPNVTTLYQKLQLLSPDGFCKTFDQSANGFTRAEGVISVLLTSNPDYIRYTPYAKIVASSMNTCGYNPIGIAFPNHERQAELYDDILKKTHTAPSEINYIECHGTGTIAGDQEELLGIKKIFGDCPTLKLGALKSNIGHTEGASGLAGLTKVLLSYETRTLYPQLHLHNKISTTGNLSLVTETEPFDKPGKVFINSFGFGGVNVCICVDTVTAPKISAPLEPKWHELYFIQSRTKEGLYELKRELEKSPQQLPIFKKITYPWREVVGLPDDPQLNAIEKRPLYFAFSGNGSQWKGMGLKLLQSSALFKETLYQCDPQVIELLLHGWEGPLQEMMLLTALQVALVELLKSLGIQADGYLGHSAGELAASYASGATTLQETMLIAHARGLAAEAIPAGLMISVGLGQQEVLPYLEHTDKVCIACINSPRNVTLSGDTKQITGIFQRLSQEGIFVREIDTHERPYHSDLIDKQKTASYMKKAYQRTVKRNPTWISAIKDYAPHDFSGDYHVESMTRPVDFLGAMLQVPENAVVLEVGPHSILRSLIRDCAPSVQYVSLMTRDLNDFDTFKSGIGRLWKLGIDITTFTDLVRPPLLVRAKQTAWNRDHAPVSKLDFKAREYKHTYVLNLQEHDAYLLGHTIDNKPIFPAMGYVYFFWQSYLKNHSNCKTVTVDNFKILRSLPLIGDQITIEVISTTNDAYQFVFGGELIAEAQLGQKDNPNPVAKMPNLPSENCIPQKTFYSLCANEGFVYFNDFQVIQNGYVSDNNGYFYANINFNHWISFLDGLLQVSILNKQADGMYLPTAIRHIELSENKSSEVIYNKNANVIQCGEIVIKGLEVSPFNKKKTPELILFQKEDYFFLGQNLLSSNKSECANHLLAYAISKFKAAQDQFIEPHHQKMIEILQNFETQENDLRNICPDHNTIMHKLIDDVYARLDTLIQSPLSCITNSPFYSQLDDDNPLTDTEYLNKMLSVIRQNAHSHTINLLEIGSGSGGFLKQAGTSLTAYDTIVCTDVADNQFIHNQITEGLAIQHHRFNLNQDISNDIKQCINKADLIVGSNSFHTSQHLQKSLDEFFTLMKPGAFMFLEEFTSPLYLALFGLCREIWNFEDQRAFGPWTSLHHWKSLFKTSGFELISYLTSEHEVQSSFLVRKPLLQNYNILTAPTQRYDDSWANPIKEALEPSILYEKKASGAAGFARTLHKEGKPVLSFCAPRLDDFWDELKAYGLVTNVVTDNKLATLCYSSQSLTNASATDFYHVEFNEPGLLDTFKFVKSRKRTGALCKVDFAALNFRDVMLASGKINKESLIGFSRHGSGIGIEFSGHHKNQRIMGIGLDTIANYLHTPFFWDVPDDMDLMAAASIPVAYLTVYYSFFERANIKPQHKVLIHAGAGAVGQAAIRVALDVGCEVFTTCHQSKREALKLLFPQLDDAHIADSRSTQFEQQIMEQTQGLGVDILLNSLADDKLQASIHCLAQHGTFIEIGKYDLMQNTPIGLKPFLYNITFCGIDVDQIFTNTAVMERISTKLLDGLHRKVVQPTDCSVFKWDKIPDALRYLGSGKHIGKVLIDMRDAVPEIIENRFYTQGAHLIVGGLGGIGMAMAEWLAERGAEHLILSSRTGICRGEQKLFMQRMKAKYPSLTVEITTVDFTNAKTTKTFFDTCTPLTGIYNLALVLNDTLFENMTQEKWEGTVSSKAQLTQHLDKYTRHHPLKHFVCFSSIATQGNPGQSNYAFANNFMESICYDRHKKGLPGMAIQWGAIGNVGFVANQDESVLKILKSFCSLQSISSCLEYLQACLLTNNVVNVVHRYPENEQKNAVVEDGDFITKISQVLKIDLYSLPDTTTLFELGVDSLQAAEIQAQLSSFNQNLISIMELGKLTIGELKAMLNAVESEDQVNSEEISPEGQTSAELEESLQLKALLVQHGEENLIEELL
ncbi:MAG: beta-ketoacyl synthase N-terminal-like domain-containing protein [Gammaproteobacteria bacterium]|nr:beta-ketoacyl synthase N-terminal-like domain-containing protein [Gammaproteobacteria bacterium]